MTLEQRFSDLVRAEPSRPFITYYDESSGERTELSVKSLANWVAKTHHLLATELGLGAGDAAVVALPSHWISVPALLGCLSAGLTVSTRPAEAGAAVAAVAFVEPASLAAAAGAADVYAVNPARAAAGFGDAPPLGTQDYVGAVRPQADAWASVRPGAGAHDPFDATLSREQALAVAADRAAALGWAPGARVLSTRGWATTADWIDTLFAPLAVGGSVVYVHNCSDPAVLARRVEQERCTATV